MTWPATSTRPVAVASNLKEKPVKKDMVVIREIGLSAEVRSVRQIDLRIKEAERLGFKQCVIPKNNLSRGLSGGGIDRGKYQRGL